MVKTEHLFIFSFSLDFLLAKPISSGTSSSYTFEVPSYAPDPSKRKPLGVLLDPNPYRADMGWEEKIIFGNLPEEATIWLYTISGELVKKMKHKSETAGGIAERDISNVASRIHIYKSKEFKKKGKIGVVK